MGLGWGGVMPDAVGAGGRVAAWVDGRVASKADW